MIVDQPLILSATDAQFLGKFPNGSDEWHEVRSKGIGGSEVGTIAGLNKWESAYTLWAKKSGLIPDRIEQSEAMEAGSKLEKFIFSEWFAPNHPDWQIWGDVGTYADGFSHANPDGVFFDGEAFGIWECKTARFEDDWTVLKRGELGTGEMIPRHYYSQVQWYLRVMGFDRAIVSVLFGGQKYREYLVLADQTWQDADLLLAERFWECVQSGEAPAWDGSKSTYETVREQNPDIVEGSVELPADLAHNYQLALYNSRQIDEELTRLKSEILAFMGSAKSATIGGEVRLVRQAGRNGAAPFLVNKEK